MDNDTTDTTERIDITPTWTAIMPALLNMLTHGNVEAQRTASHELMTLARKVDEAAERMGKLLTEISEDEGE